MVMPRMSEVWWFMRHADVLDMGSGVPGPWGLEGVAPSAPPSLSIQHTSSCCLHSQCVWSIMLYALV